MNAYIHTYIHTYTHTYIHTEIHTYRHAYLRTHTFIHIITYILCTMRTYTHARTNNIKYTCIHPALQASCWYCIYLAKSVKYSIEEDKNISSRHLGNIVQRFTRIVAHAGVLVHKTRQHRWHKLGQILWYVLIMLCLHYCVWLYECVCVRERAYAAWL